MLSLSLAGTSPTLSLPPTFITQQVQASFVVWNSGGGRLTGTVSVPAPFSIVSGGSFSLLPGQPQEVVVRFSSGTAGSFSKSITISSNGGSKTVTATGVAHKVSFSPGQLDFGSGLFVLWEQCDDTGGCKLRIEKVGLPIEKSLTVKNEGTVAVSLTLSTSAPYKLVSVLPTLSPGQSAQVTLRFDPSESGIFTGNVQVGIQDGQGSVTAPLVGTAHKIEISPATLNFGVVILSNPKQRWLTIKNEGQTTANLTLSTSQADLEIISGNMLNLVPGTEQVVKLRFNPSARGEFQRSLFVSAGTSTLGILALGKVYSSVEEYLQELLQAYNQQRQECYSAINTTFNGDCGIGAIGAPISDRDEFLLVGFNELTPAQVISYQNMAGAYVDVPTAVVEELIELTGLFVELDNLDPDLVASWWQRLQDALAIGQFDEEYAVLLQDSRFSRYHQLLGQFLSTTDIEQIKAFVRSSAESFSAEGGQPDLITLLLEYLLPRLVRQGHLTQEQADTFKDKLRRAANIVGGRAGYEFMNEVAAILIQFDRAHEVAGPGMGQLPSYSGFVDKLNFILDQIINPYISDWRQGWVDKIKVAGQGARNGWLIMNILVDLGSQNNRDPNGRFIDIVAWNTIGGDRRVVAFLKVDSRYYDPEVYKSIDNFRNMLYYPFYNLLSAMINHVMRSGDAYLQYGSGDYVIGIIFTRSQDPTVMENLASTLATGGTLMTRLPKTDYPVFLAFWSRDASGNRQFNVYIICPAGGCSDQMIQQAVQAACDFGIGAIQSANTNIPYVCANGRTVNVKTFKQPSPYETSPIIPLLK